MTLALIGLVLFILFSIRSYWIQYKLAEHSYLVDLYLIYNDKYGDVHFAAEMLQIWPVSSMFFHSYNWNFDKFIVNQNLLHDMQSYFDNRENISFSVPK